MVGKVLRGVLATTSTTPQSISEFSPSPVGAATCTAGGDGQRSLDTHGQEASKARENSDRGIVCEAHCSPWLAY